MYTVKYMRYRHDYDKHMEEKRFYSLENFADWLFDKCEGRYKDRMFFIDPDCEIPYYKGKLDLDNSCISTKYDDTGYATWVEMIVKDNAIIYSTGKFTNGICHWNEEIKQWLRDCRARQLNPQFNFG